LVIQIPFDDQFAVSIDMNMPRRVISLPPKQKQIHRAVSYPFAMMMLPYEVTFTKPLRNPIRFMERTPVFLGAGPDIN
jgi:hypothetical protein